MDRKEIIESLSKIEMHFPVNEWKYGDIQIWPYIKSRLFFMLFNQISSGYTVNTPSLPCKLSRFTSSVDAYCFARKAIRNKKILLAGAPVYQTAFNGKYINKFYEPIFGDDPESIYIERGIKKNDLPYKNSVIELNKVFDFFKIKNKLIPLRSDLKLEGWDYVYQLVPNIMSRINQKELNIEFMGQNILFMSSVFENLLKKTSIKTLYSLCYYFVEMFALNYVANKMGIKTIDLQHGGLGSLHPLYTYSNFPKAGFNIIPNNFHVWDYASRKHLESWIHCDSKYVVKEVGNPWLKFVLDNNTEKIKETRKIILYTLQFDEIDGYIFDAVRLTSEEYIWWFRLHPRMTIEREKIIKQIKKENLEEKIKLDEANTLPLPIILKNCFIHISKFSGSIIEAEQFNKKTIILEETGIENYKEYIKYGNSIGLLEPTGEQIYKIIIEN